MESSPDDSRQHVEHGPNRSQLGQIDTVLNIASEPFHHGSIAQCSAT